jgi:hypothetical protein
MLHMLHIGQRIQKSNIYRHNVAQALVMGSLHTSQVMLLFNLQIINCLIIILVMIVVQKIKETLNKLYVSFQAQFLNDCIFE